MLRIAAFAIRNIEITGAVAEHKICTRADRGDGEMAGPVADRAVGAGGAAGHPGDQFHVNAGQRFAGESVDGSAFEARLLRVEA